MLYKYEKIKPMNYLNVLEQLQSAIMVLARQYLLVGDAAILRQTKLDGSFVTMVDKAMQQEIAVLLANLTPDIPMLGEEMDGISQAALLADAECLWCVDPLDGTTNFASHLPYYCVSVALLVNQRPVLALIYDPIRAELFTAVRGEGAWLNGQVLQTRACDLSLSECIALIDFKRLEIGLRSALIQDPPYASQRSYGSGALDWCWIAAGRCQLYLHGNQNLWDYAAGYLILQEAGGHSASLDKNPVYHASLSKRSVVAAADGQLFKQWQAWLEDAC